MQHKHAQNTRSSPYQQIKHPAHFNHQTKRPSQRTETRNSQTHTQPPKHKQGEEVTGHRPTQTHTYTHNNNKDNNIHIREHTHLHICLQLSYRPAHTISQTPTKQKHVLNNGNNVKKYHKLGKRTQPKTHTQTHPRTLTNNSKNNTGQARGPQHTCNNKHSKRPDAHKDPRNKPNPQDERRTPAGLQAYTDLTLQRPLPCEQQHAISHAPISSHSLWPLHVTSHNSNYHPIHGTEGIS